MLAADAPIILTQGLTEGQMNVDEAGAFAASELGILDEDKDMLLQNVDAGDVSETVEN
jgi:hypothetical protein